MKLFQRKQYLDKIIPHMDKHIIKIIVGMRRSGKSVILNQIMNYLITNNNIAPENIVLIDKEDEKYDSMTTYKDLSSYIKNSFKNITGKKYVFIDEVQLIESWEKIVNSWLKTGDYDIYLTGSNSSMLSSKISTLIAGRYIDFEVHPLSFREYYKFTEGKFTDTNEAFDYYVRYGGLPYNLCYSKEQLEDDIIHQYLRAVYNTVILKDIVEVNSIRDASELDRISKYMFNNVGNITAAVNISKYLKTVKSGLAVATVISYLKYFTDSYLMHKCQRYDIEGKRLLTINSKFYSSDIGIINSTLGYSQKRIGGILENIVYMELVRNGYNVSVGYINGKEIDFIGEKRNKKVYIQVALQLGDPEGNTYKREYTPLLAIKDNYPKYILTMEGRLAGEGEYGIQRINIIEFLLKNKL
jgi:uncharacterized protein